MISENIESSLNSQLKLEANASMQYLAMASWAEINGYNGVAGFFYSQSEEEKMHMLKLIKFVNERGGTAIVPALEKPENEFESLQELFTTFLESEEKVTNSVNQIVFECLEVKDYTTHNFMQWYVAEQTEEEALARTILDKLRIIGDDKGGLYLFDRDIESLDVKTENE